MYQIDYSIQACDLGQAYKIIGALDQRNSPVLDDDIRCEYHEATSHLAVACTYQFRLRLVNQVFIDSAHHFDTKPVLVDPPPWMREIDEHLLVYLVLQFDQYLVVEILADLNRNGADDIQSGHQTWQENNFALRLEFQTDEECLTFQLAYSRGSATDRGQSPGEECAGTIFPPPGRSATLFIIELTEKEAFEVKQRLCAEEFDPRPTSVARSIYLNVTSSASRLRSVDQAFVDAAARFRMKPVLVNPPPWL